MSDPLAGKYVIDPKTGCWVWSLGKDKDGYGKVKIGGRTLRAHRVSLGRRLGRDLRPDELACHSCDRPECMNPDHLFVGDHAVNHGDRNSKGRQAQGERHGRSKLTDADVRTLREDRPGERVAAELFGISRTQYYRLLRGEQRSAA